jgi:membrane protein implicated in regulation of membrane protease activity
MKPINWLVGFVELLLTAGFLGGSSFWVQVVSFVFMVVIMAVYFSIYIYWMLRNPNRLQSEGYNLEVMNVLNDNTDAKLSAEHKKPSVKVSERN